jgi:hypothetical protein
MSLAGVHGAPGASSDTEPGVLRTPPNAEALTQLPYWSPFVTGSRTASATQSATA